MYNKSRKTFSSTNEALTDIQLSVSKDSLKEAIALIYEEGFNKSKDFGGARTLKKCHLASLKSHNLCSAAEIFSPEPSTAIEILDELRLSLLENNFPVTAILLKWLSHSSSRLFLPVIWKTAAVLFLNHYSFNGCHDEFLETCADQRSTEDKRRLIKALVCLPDVLESKSKKFLKHNPSSSIKMELDIDDPDDDYWQN